MLLKFFFSSTFPKHILLLLYYTPLILFQNFASITQPAVSPFFYLNHSYLLTHKSYYANQLFYLPFLSSSTGYLASLSFCNNVYIHEQKFLHCHGLKKSTETGIRAPKFCEGLVGYVYTRFNDKAANLFNTKIQLKPFPTTAIQATTAKTMPNVEKAGNQRTRVDETELSSHALNRIFRRAYDDACTDAPSSNKDSPVGINVPALMERTADKTARGVSKSPPRSTIELRPLEPKKHCELEPEPKKTKPTKLYVVTEKPETKTQNQLQKPKQWQKVQLPNHPITITIT